VAEDALTALRAELYATPRGKERHLAMERKLVAALPSQAGSDGRDEASAENSELGGQP
jgi:hypothetical protein